MRYDAHVSRPLKPTKKSVELAPAPRPSRIRRDPVPADKPSALKELRMRSDGWEIAIAVVGMVAFAVAIDIITVAVFAYWK